MCDVSQEDIIPSILSTSAREDNKFQGNTYNCPPPLTIAIRLHCELRVELSLTYDEGASKQMHGRLMKMRIDGTTTITSRTIIPSGTIQYQAPRIDNATLQLSHSHHPQQFTTNKVLYTELA